MSLDAIQSALREHLLTLVTAENVDVAWPNRSFQPTGNYISPFVIPVDSMGVGIENSSTEQFMGFYQVSIYEEKGKGSPFTRDLSTKLTQHFYRGLVLDVTTSSRLIIERSYASAQMEYDQKYMLTPVTIDYKGLYR